MRPSNPVFGARGDFITSPEISQVFGEVRPPEQRTRGENDNKRCRSRNIVGRRLVAFPVVIEN
jgi:hypothetical protein